MSKIDPITAEAIGSFFMAVAEEMGLKQRGDCSPAIFDATGRTVAQAPRLPIHLGSILGLVTGQGRRHGVSVLVPEGTFARGPLSQRVRRGGSEG